jgi:hypothetical protein
MKRFQVGRTGSVIVAKLQSALQAHSERVIFCHLAYEAGWRYRYSMDFSLLQDGVA